MVLKLTVLHVLNEWEVKLGHVIFVHVKEDIADHDNTFFDFLPDSIEF